MTVKKQSKTKKRSGKSVVKKRVTHRFYVRVKPGSKTIADLDTRRDLMLVSDSQDIRAVKEHLGNPKWFEYGCLFVKVGEGDYEEIWGCESTVPRLHYLVDEIEWGYK
jgi:hypothetical protein